jgi:hypothetical protein
MRLEKFEDLQRESESIKETVFNIFYNKPQAVEDSINRGYSDIVHVKCTKCLEDFSSLAELKYHKNCEEKFPEDLYENSDEDFVPKKRKSRKKKLIIEENFDKLAKENGLDYNIEKFHKAFGAPSEGPSKNPKGKKEEPPSRICPTFASTLRKHGINYDLQTFHRVFGFSDQLEINKNSKKKGFKCSKCGEEYEKLQDYKNHVKTHPIGNFR